MISVTLPSARSNLKRSSGPKSNVVDVPIAKHRYVESTIRSDPPLSGKNFWLVENERGTFYLSMNNDAELRALTGKPNPDFSPNIFELQRGSQAGRYIIYIYAMIPNKKNERYALTVVKDLDDQWRLKYGLCNQQNSHDYEWCFSYRDNAFAIRWCGNSNTSGKDFVFYLDNDQLKLTSHTQNQPLLPGHFISSFHST